ncbi:hypothetical protein [Kitasatospora herbaricolor]|uniref:Uncharacterized protein n=1 Tax=Kitasatospora herbaricolor TaxID=68217 RepID=A0ABZ1WIE1_9ACTN|nr:hypothetical protein [Kitasatospora herbaricolor]
MIHVDEGDWLIGDGVNDPNLPGASGVYSIACMAEVDPSLAGTAALRPGFAAYRDGPGLPWTIEPFSYEDDEDQTVRPSFTKDPMAPLMPPAGSPHRRRRPPLGKARHS